MPAEKILFQDKLTTACCTFKQSDWSSIQGIWRNILLQVTTLFGKSQFSKQKGGNRFCLTCFRAISFN